MAVQDFFYDDQIKRYLLQFIRLMSNFSIQTGLDRNGIQSLISVPVKYGDSSRQVGHIQRDNTQTSLLPVPMISCYISNIKYSREWVTEPFFVDKVFLRERDFNPVTQDYETKQGNTYTIERFMPVPYTLTFVADVWTSNTRSKLQLFEQIVPLFNPAFEIQSTDNYIDWTSLSLVELTDMSWSSGTIGLGNVDDQIEFFTLTFESPIWLSLPIKVKKQGVIHKIIASIYDDDGGIQDNIIEQSLLMDNRQLITPLNAGIFILNNQIKLLRQDEITTPRDTDIDPDGSQTTITDTPPLEWPAFVNQYGELTNGITQVRLLQNPQDDPDSPVETIGTVAFHPSDDSILLFTPDTDTFPANTLTALNAIINPQNSGPGNNLPTSQVGQRYLLIAEIGHTDNIDGADAWKGTGNEDLIANTNDIVEYDGTQWNISFDSTDTSTIEYVTNTTTNIQYEWNQVEWLKSWEGEYKGGEWSIVI